MPADTSKACKDDFHRERSRFLDAFAGLDEALLRSRSSIKEERLAEQIKALRAIRNDLVHSQLRFVALDGQLHAVAINAQHVIEVARQGRLLRIEDFKVLLGKIGTAKRDVEAA